MFLKNYTDAIFTIVIPTLNRCAPLRGAIRSALDSDYHNLRVLVSNNCSDDDTEEFCHRIIDERFSYVKTEFRMGMSKHWDFALKHVEDGYVMFLGDDDAVLPNSVTYLVNMMRQHNVECVSCQNYVRFLWPDEILESQGSLYMRLYGGSKVASTKQALSDIMLGVNADFHYLPNLYHGAASTHLINRLRDADGNFFLGLSPDVYSAIALASGTDSFLSVERPLTIGGVSPSSNGMQCLGNTPESINKMEKFIEASQIPPHPEIGVYTKSLQLAYYEHYLKLPTHIPRKVITNFEIQINIGIHHIREAGDLSELDRLHQLAIDRGIRIVKFKFNLIKLIYYILSRLKLLIGGVYISNPIKVGVSDSYEACVYCDGILRENIFSKIILAVKNYLNRLT
jgi:glycosyltransferase involved in cell wall biosynthesis